MACLPCGNEGERCCADDSCSDNLTCSSDNNCGPCGAEGQPCCKDTTCDVGLGCDATNICKSSIGPSPPSPPSPDPDGGGKAPVWLVPVILGAVLFVAFLAFVLLRKKEQRLNMT